ncbi:hypothetical protein D3C86_1382840 [compost metagenome]
MNLTKAQEQFFTRFVEDATRSTLQDVRTPAEIDEFITGTDLSPMVQEYAESLLKQVDFTALKRVDRFLRSDEYLAVMAAIENTLTEVTRRTDEIT